MPRYKLTLEYDGAPFVGWQRQDNGPSIQGALEDAVFAFCGERVAVHGAGRTDTGVHALGQVAHLDLAEEKPTDTVRAAVNFHLKPHPIVIIEAEIVPGERVPANVVTVNASAGRPISRPNTTSVEPAR